jgi:hypothetical protein
MQRPSAHVRRRGRRAVMKKLKKQASSRENRFSKILFALSRCRIADEALLKFWWTNHTHVVRPRPLPHHVMPRPAQRGERAYVLLSFSYTLHTYKCIESNPLFI